VTVAAHSCFELPKLAFQGSLRPLACLNDSTPSRIAATSQIALCRLKATEIGTATSFGFSDAAVMCSTGLGEIADISAWHIRASPELMFAIGGVRRYHPRGVAL
jgi:hypothetical protein